MAKEEQQILSLDIEPSPSLEEIDGRDEMNLAEFPLFTLKRRVAPGEKTLTFSTQGEDRRTGRKVCRKFQMTAGDAYGLPTARDGDVLLALLYFAKEQNALRSSTVHFSRYEMARLLGWDDGGKSYQRISDALFKWLGVTLEYQKSWWDKGDKRWKTVGFHLLEKVEIADCPGRRRQQELPFSYVRFSEDFFRSLQNGYVKKINLAEFFSLDVPAAKHMYRFLDKRFYNQKRLEFDLRDFACERIGFSRSYKPSRLKIKLQPALKELEEMGFIKPATDEERYRAGQRTGEWTIVFERAKRSALAKPLTGNKSKRASNRVLIKELTDRGLTTTFAQQVVDENQIDEALIRLQIEHLDWLIAEPSQTAPANPGGWLRKAILEGYTPPSDFKTKSQREEQQKERAAYARSQARKAQEERLAEQDKRQEIERDKRRFRDEWSHVEGYLHSLTDEEREALFDQAIEDHAAGDFQRSRIAHYRVSMNPGATGEIDFKTVVLAAVRPLLEVTTA